MAKTTIKNQKAKIKNKEGKSKDASSAHPISQLPSLKKSPQTMEELLAATGYRLTGLKKGDVVEGTIARISPKEMTIDIGRKTDAVVIDRELENYKDILMHLNVGEKVSAQVIVEENDRGQPVLSLRKSIFEKRWNDLAAAQKNGTPIEVLFKEPVRGGILAEYGGLRGYIPQSQLDAATLKQADKLSGRKADVKVLEVDRETNRLVFSQRAVAEGETLAKQKELLALLKVDDTVQAAVTGIVPFGVFARIHVIRKDGTTEEVEGLIHISEIAWEKVGDPGQYLKTGDSIKVKIIGLDTQTGKITLSLKQLLPDPWEHVLDQFPKESMVKGTVSRVSPIGIFVTLLPGVEGLIHISKISPGEEPKEGDEITCLVEDVQPDKRKISLSMALTEKPIGYR
ncbi:S1 RNA-binding domain-containing protein [Patescibacteria group bacterium]|nr:S1 RNA-binding domain-containing protein [Patescibacteria group bacterium]